MTQIAGIQDFRQEGPPADIGTFQFPATAIAFQFVFSGVTYTVVIAAGVDGWTPIAQSVAGVDNPDLQAAIDYIESLGGGVFHVKNGNYAGLQLTIAFTTIIIVGEHEAVFSAATGQYAITVGNGAARVADNTQIRLIDFSADALTALGAIFFNGPCVRCEVWNCSFTGYGVDTEYAVKQLNSWEIKYVVCVFWNTQHDVLINNIGYATFLECIFDASDVGGHASVYNYGVYLDSGSGVFIRCFFELNNTTGVAIRVDYGSFETYSCHWENGSNLLDIWITANPPRGSKIFGLKPSNRCMGLWRYPKCLFVDGRFEVIISPRDAVEALGGGTITRHGAGVRMVTNNVNGALTTWHLMWWGHGSDPTSSWFREGPAFHMYMRLNEVTDVEHWFVQGVDPTNATPDPSRHFGLHIVNGRIWITSGDGGAGSRSDTGIDVTAGQDIEFRVERRSASIWVRYNNRTTIVGDDLLVTHTTNLPDWETSAGQLFWAAIRTNADAAKTVDFIYPKITHGEG